MHALQIKHKKNSFLLINGLWCMLWRANRMQNTLQKLVFETVWDNGFKFPRISPLYVKVSQDILKQSDFE